jgi:glycosyltransferase involved in cell wall biosynthesis
MRKIFHITNAHAHDDPRVFGRHCLSLVSKGYDVSFVGPFDICSTVIQGVKINSIKKSRTRMGRFTITNFKLIKEVVKSKPDLVEFHDPDFILWVLPLKLLGFKVIANIHEDIASQILNKYWLPPILRRTASLLLRLTFPIVVNILCNGRVCATDKIGSIFKKKNTTICRNFPTNSFAVSRTMLPEQSLHRDQLSLVYVGVLEERRGLDIMLQLSDSLLVSSLRLVGKFSPKNLENKVRSFASQNQKIQVVGEVPHEDIRNHIDICDIGLCFLEENPAYVESLPTKIFEYLVRGKPVIANNYPALRELYKEKEFGILVNNTDQSTIEKALIDILHNYDKYSNLSLKAAKVFSWENEEEKYLELIENVI